MAQPSIADVIRSHEDRLLSLPHVQAVGEGERSGQPVIVVLVSGEVSDSSPEPNERIPATLDGFDVVIQRSGIISASGGST